MDRESNEPRYREADAIAEIGVRVFGEKSHRRRAHPARPGPHASRMSKRVIKPFSIRKI
jgi:hypothetical protein